MRSYFERNKQKSQPGNIQKRELPKLRPLVRHPMSTNRIKDDEFVLYFPTSMHVTQRYASEKEVQNAMENESIEAAFDTSLVNNYVCIVLPRQSNVLRINYKCKYCDALIQLMRSSVDESFELVALQNQHRHRYWEVVAQTAEAAEKGVKHKYKMQAPEQTRKQPTKESRKEERNVRDSSKVYPSLKLENKQSDFERLLKQQPSLDLKRMRKMSEQEQQQSERPPGQPAAANQPLSFTESEKVEYNKIKQLLTERKCLVKEDSHGTEVQRLTGWSESRMVIISPCMKQNYRKWGDCVTIELFSLNTPINANITRTFKIIVFLVSDGNAATLLAGLAVLGEETIASVSPAVKMFLQTPKTPPETIITPYNRCMSKSIRILIEGGNFKGSHLYTHFSIINHLERKLTGTNQQKLQLIETVKETIYCRNPEDFHQNLKKIQSDPTNGTVAYDFLVSKLNRTCLCKIPANFSGLYSRGYTSFINRFSNKLIGEKGQNLLPFIKNMLALDETLEVNSRETNRLYIEPVEKFFADFRINGLRKQLCYDVFGRFLENYIKSMKDELKLNNGDSPDEKIVSTTRSSYTFRISKWKCECCELEKTGVPCPHLLFYCKETSSRKYVELFRPRWVQQRPMTQSNATQVIEIDD